MSASGLPLATPGLLKILRFVADNHGIMHMTVLIRAMDPLAFDRHQVQRIVFTGRTAGVPVLENSKHGGNTHMHETVTITDAGRKMLDECGSPAASEP